MWGPRRECSECSECSEGCLSVRGGGGPGNCREEVSRSTEPHGPMSSSPQQQQRRAGALQPRQGSRSEAKRTDARHTKAIDSRLSAPLRMARRSELWWWRGKCSGKQGGFVVDDAGGQESKPSDPCRREQLAPALLAMDITNKQHGTQLSRRRWMAQLPLYKGLQPTSSRPRSRAFQPPSPGTLYHARTEPSPRGVHLLHAHIPHSQRPPGPALTPTQEETCRAAAKAVQPGASSAIMSNEVAGTTTLRQPPPKENPHRDSWPHALLLATSSHRTCVMRAEPQGYLLCGMAGPNAVRYHLNSDSSPPNRSQRHSSSFRSVLVRAGTSACTSLGRSCH